MERHQYIKGNLEYIAINYNNLLSILLNEKNTNTFFPSLFIFTTKK